MVDLSAELRALCHECSDNARKSDLTKPVRQAFASVAFQLAMLAEAFDRADLRTAFGESPEIVRLNLKHYNALLATSIDGSKRQLVVKLRDHASAALAVIEGAQYDAPRPSC